MDSFFDFLGPNGFVYERLLAAAFLGGVVGFERERSAKTAGLRTHTLVALGSALFTVISFLVYRQFNGTLAGYDSRVVANIITGIGFIGGGVILQTQERIKGITTAASLWTTAAIGVASGFGFYREAAFTVLLVYVILRFLWFVEERLKSKF
ncbi:MAG: MgtC/SapB family protein, partial [Acidobacteria bacterium]|nr:MgtC/SapB family protein [Acidobacteriota bacterium]